MGGTAVVATADAVWATAVALPANFVPAIPIAIWVWITAAVPVLLAVAVCGIGVDVRVLVGVYVSVGVKVRLKVGVQVAIWKPVGVGIGVQVGCKPISVDEGVLEGPEPSDGPGVQVAGIRSGVFV